MTESKYSGTLEDLVTAAEAALLALEAARPGAWIEDDERRGRVAPWAGTLQEAENAVGELRLAAIAELFPDRIVAVGSDLWADFDAYTKPTRYSGERMGRLHGIALDGYPELAALFRTANVLETVHLERGKHEAIFVSVVAEQLAGRGECLPASRILASDVPALEARMIEATESCKTEAEAKSHTELAAWFREHLTRTIPVRLGHEALTRSEISERIERGDEELIDCARHYWLNHPAGGGQTTRGRAIFS